MHLKSSAVAQIDWPEYSRLVKDMTTQHVLDEDRTVKKGGWADPHNFYKDPNFKRVRRAFLPSIQIDPKSGRPLNPVGRTGMQGRGRLGKWGPNMAADSVVVRELPEKEAAAKNRQPGSLEVLMVQRFDTKQWCAGLFLVLRMLISRFCVRGFAFGC